MIDAWLDSDKNANFEKLGRALRKRCVSAKGAAEKVDEILGGDTDMCKRSSKQCSSYLGGGSMGWLATFQAFNLKVQ